MSIPFIFVIIMKSYTDLEQSKKLVEILPLESADMNYFNWDNTTDKPFVSDVHENLVDYTPCWSLAALYHILPNTKHASTTLSRGGWKIEPIEYLDNWWCEYEDENHTKDFTVSADNPVDACYEMILKLHEQKLL